MADENPKVFISYSWDNDAHKDWVREFATRLRGDGVNVTLDQWETAPGDKLPHFMEKSIRENRYVLIVCTPNYKKKSDAREGGVGYEGDIMTGTVFNQGNHRKFIPVLRQGDFKTDIPNWLDGSYGIDLSKDDTFEMGYRDLLTTIYNARDKAPPIGQKPSFSEPKKTIREASKEFMTAKENITADWEPIKITGIIIDEIGEPKNDGTRGSALYRVPFRLSRRPSTEWGNLFVHTWDHPPQYTTRHRPGIALVRGEKVILDGTTMEEVKEVHRDTLKFVLDEVNKQFIEIAKKRKEADDAKERQKAEHREKIRKSAEDFSFD